MSIKVRNCFNHNTIKGGLQVLSLAANKYLVLFQYKKVQKDIEKKDFNNYKISAWRKFYLNEADYCAVLEVPSTWKPLTAAMVSLVFRKCRGKIV